MLPQLVNIWFQVLFHSAPAVLFTFPSRYWFTIAHSFIFSLGGWSRLLPTRFLVSRRTQDPTGTRSGFRLQGLHPLRPRFRSRSSILLFPFRGPSTPLLKTVWAPSLSLAATQEITVVFFSSGYLDVSVPRVALQQLWIHRWMAGFFSCRVPPFGHLRLFAPLTAPRSFSQFGTSFFTFEWQGILRTPFLT